MGSWKDLRPAEPDSRFARAYCTEVLFPTHQALQPTLEKSGSCCKEACHFSFAGKNASMTLLKLPVQSHMPVICQSSPLAISRASARAAWRLPETTKKQKSSFSLLCIDILLTSFSAHTGPGGHCSPGLNFSLRCWKLIQCSPRKTIVLTRDHHSKTVGNAQRLGKSMKVLRPL